MLVGLTGGLASGKSLVSREFLRLGASVIDADEISREVMRPGTDVYREIVREFGRQYLKDDGTINRKRLGKLVFSDPQRLKRLNEITHPAIRRAIEDRIRTLKETKGDALIVVDAALLIETGLYKKMDRVIVVYADEEKQIERLVKRDHLSGDEAKRRINAQMPLREKLKFADFVVDNNGTVEETVERVREIFARLTGKGS